MNRLEQAIIEMIGANLECRQGVDPEGNRAAVVRAYDPLLDSYHVNHVPLTADQSDRFGIGLAIGLAELIIANRNAPGKAF